MISCLWHKHWNYQKVPHQAKQKMTAAAWGYMPGDNETSLLLHLNDWVFRFLFTSATKVIDLNMMVQVSFFSLFCTEVESGSWQI